MRNHIMHPLLLLLTGCVSSGSDSGDLISRQLAQELSNGQIYLEIPDGFPAFEVPEGLEVVGALDRNFSIQVILQSELEKETMQQRVREQFRQQGWIAMESPRFQQPATGFISSAPNFPNLPDNQFCNDRQGMISITDRSDQGIYHRINLEWNPGNSGPGRLTCEEQNQQRRGQFNPGFFPGSRLAESLPVLELPEEDRASRFRPFFGGPRNSGDSVEVTTPLILDWELDRINDWFARQLREQGWMEDAGWTGSRTAGSTWVTTTEGDRALVGILSILKTGEDNFQLKFIMQPGSGTNGAGRFF